DRSRDHRYIRRYQRQRLKVSRCGEDCRPFRHARAETSLAQRIITSIVGATGPPRQSENCIACPRTAGDLLRDMFGENARPAPLGVPTPQHTKLLEWKVLVHLVTEVLSFGRTARTHRDPYVRA